MSQVAGPASWDRGEARAQVLPVEIKGLLTHADLGLQLPFLVWDVSESGMGIWLNQSLRVGSNVMVALSQPYLFVVECRAVWCQQNEPGRYRIGLAVVENTKGFRALYNHIRDREEQAAKADLATLKSPGLRG
jgi:hypothetical protein